MDNVLKLLYIAQCTHNATAVARIIERPEQLPKLNPLSNDYPCSPEDVRDNETETFEKEHNAKAGNGGRRTRTRRKKANYTPIPPADEANTMTGFNKKSRFGLDRIHIYCRNHSFRALIYNTINKFSGKTTWNAKTISTSSKAFKDMNLANCKVSVRFYGA